MMNDLIAFIERHRQHGTLTGDATEPTEQGYLLTVQCSCEVTFMRWVSETDAVSHLVLSSLLSTQN
jgi:hypothetical protein